jgi:hypothetical protein
MPATYVLGVKTNASKPTKCNLTVEIGSVAAVMNVTPHIGFHIGIIETAVK